MTFYQTPIYDLNAKSRKAWKQYTCCRSNNVHEKITRFWLAENECILVQHECKVVTRVQL